MKKKINYAYPCEYLGPRPIIEQIYAIAIIFGLDPSDALKYIKKLSKLPDNADGWFAIPKVSAVSSGGQYSEACSIAVKKLGNSRIFQNDAEDVFTSKMIRQDPITNKFMKQIQEEQVGDIVIIPAQYGIQYCGKSVAETKKNLNSNEFCIGMFAIACMALVHQCRYFGNDTLGTCCAGDEYFPDGCPLDSGQVLALYYYDNKLVLESNFTFRNFCNIGIVTGFYF